MTDSSPLDRRAEILEAARRCLARHGYDKTTMEDVGREVGLNKASLYYYFPGKEALVSEVIGAETQEFIGDLQARVEKVTGCGPRITAYLTERFRIYEKVLNLHRLSIQALRQVGPVMKKLYKDHCRQEIAFVQSILDYCVERGEITACDTARIAANILTVVDGFKMTVIGNPDAPPGATIDYACIEGDVVDTVSLMLEGLKVRG